MESYIKKHKNSKTISFIQSKVLTDVDKKTSFFLLSILLSLLSFQGSKLFLVSAILSFGYILDFSYFLIGIISTIVSGILLGPMYFLFFTIVFLVFCIVSLLGKKIKIKLILKSALIAFFSDFIARLVFLFISNETFNYKVIIASLMVVFIFNLGVNISFLLTHQKIGKIRQEGVLSLFMIIILSIGGVLELLDNPLIGYILLSLVFIFASQVFNISLFSYALITSSLAMSILLNISVEQISLFLIPVVVIVLLNKKNKYGVVATYLLTYVFILITQNKNILQLSQYISPVLASLLYICIPSFVMEDVKNHIFNIETFEKENIMHVKKLEIEVAKKLESMATLFNEISLEYKSDDSHKLIRKQTSLIFHNLCINCPKNKQCYQNKENRNIPLFLKSITLELNKDDIEIITNNCMKPSRFLELSAYYKNEFYREYNFNEQYKQLKKALAYQVLGFKEMLEQYSNKIKTETLPFIDSLEEEIKSVVLSLNIDLVYLDTYKDIANKLMIVVDVKVDDISKESERINKELEKRLNKSLRIKSIEEFSLDNYHSLLIEEYEPYEFMYGIKQKGKSEDQIGDSYIVYNDEYSHIYALSDGMGTGKDAKEESGTTLKLLKSVLACGGDNKYSIMMINSFLKTKNRYDTYATLDLLTVDNKTLKASFSKNGSPCSYIYRDKDLIKIDSSSLPIGIIDNVKVLDNEVQLKENDLIIMFSDGINDNEKKMKDVMNNCYHLHPQQIAKEIMDNFFDNKVNDDTSVMIIKIKKKV